jgi:HK97 family phage portal protein
MLADKLFKRSLENPATPINDQTLSQAIGEMKTIAGVSITPLSSLRATAVYACVRVIAETIATLPLHVYEQSSDGSKKITEGLPEYKILRDSPNPVMTSVLFREVLQCHALLGGNGYAEIEWTVGGQVRALWPIIFPTEPRLLASGKKVFVVYKPDGQVMLNDEDVIHIPALSMDGIVGLSPIKTARQAIGMALAAEEFGGRLFSNGLRASGVLSLPTKLSESAFDRLKKQVNENNAGLSNAAKPMILEEGLKWDQTSISPDDAQFLETRKYQTIEIARLYRVPPHKIGELEKTTVGNSEDQSQSFVTDTILPWLVRWEQELNRKLFADRPYFCEFNVDGLLRADTISRYRSYALGRQWGWLSTNDVRRRENMNTIPEGDEYLSPMNMQPIGGDPTQDPANPQNDPGKKGAKDGN